MYTYTYTYVRIAGLQQMLHFASLRCDHESVSPHCAPIHTALSLSLSLVRSLPLSLSFSLIVLCDLSVSVVSCVSLSVFTFYIKYCVPDDFTKLYPGIMYFTLCEATDCEKMSRIHIFFVFFLFRRYTVFLATPSRARDIV